MPRPSRYPVAVVGRPRGRPRKTPLPAARFAPIRLADAIDARPGAAPFACAFELLFPDGLTLRVARHVPSAEMECLLDLLRRRGE